MKENIGIRICCESSRGGTEYGSVDPEEKIESISSLCYSHPEKHSITPFDTFVEESFSATSNLQSSTNFRYLYGMPNCPTHDYNLPDYEWSVLLNGNLKIGNKIYNQSNYCINYGRKIEKGNKLMTEMFIRRSHLMPLQLFKLKVFL